MATLQLRNRSYRVLFSYGGKRCTYTLGRVGRREADNAAAAADQVLLRIEKRLLRVPDGADIVSFVKNGGRVEQEEKEAAPPPEPLGLRKLIDSYLAVHSIGSMEANSLATVRMHLGHFAATLGDRFPAQKLTLADLQRHVDRRAKRTYRGRPLSPVTLRKEMASFRACWNWAADGGKVQGRFPGRGLKYPKADEKLPFMTRQEVERTAAGRAGAGDGPWDCLYLTRAELDEMLAYVKKHAAHDWVYPLVCFAAHTGARRSEALRARVSDVDLEGYTVLVREKKRSRLERTTRRVPLTPELAAVLKDWLAQHPGGDHLFCHRGEVPRSKKRSRTTGHRPKGRPTTLRGRMAGVRRRAERPGPGPLTKDEAHGHFRRTLAGSKWGVLRGFHVLRHSFISALARPRAEKTRKRGRAALP